MSYTYNTTHKHKHKGDVTMYKKNKMLSAVAAVAILASGAIAFDMTKGGGIYAAKGGFDGPVEVSDFSDINTSDVNSYPVEHDANADGNGAQKTAVPKSKVFAATYLGGVKADSNMTLSANGRGDALIYPAFRTGAGWSTEIIVRNTNNRAVVAKAVLYDANDSRELLDFNIYLSQHDAFRFKIDENGKVTTRDGSYAKAADGTFETDAVQFVDHEKETVTILEKLGYEGKTKIKDVDSGYVIIYGMVESQTYGYHTKGSTQGHKDLFKDYRMALDFCRDSDGNLNNNTGSSSSENIPMTQWRRAFIENGVVNGTFTLPSGVGAPDVNITACASDINDTDTNTTRSRTARYINARNKYISEAEGKYRPAKDIFQSPSSNALFGSVRLQHEGDNRDLLLNATAIANFTDDDVGTSNSDQAMLWAGGEWASIQDRQLYHKAGDTFSSYYPQGIVDDALTFKVTHTYFTFNKDVEGVQKNTMLITQPMKRPLIQLGDTPNYWDNEGTTGNVWGDFKMRYKLYDDNEREYSAESTWVTLTSPHNTTAAAGYVQELQPIRDIEEEYGDKYFGSGTHGYADIKLGGAGKGLPAIITQMTASKVGDESQINWVYSVAD
jgi:hypothetical protein